MPRRLNTDQISSRPPPSRARPGRHLARRHRRLAPHRRLEAGPRRRSPLGRVRPPGIRDRHLRKRLRQIHRHRLASPGFHRRAGRLRLAAPRQVRALETGCPGRRNRRQPAAGPRQLPPLVRRLQAHYSRTGPHRRSRSATSTPLPFPRSLATFPRGIWSLAASAISPAPPASGSSIPASRPRRRPSTSAPRRSWAFFTAPKGIWR